MRLSLALLIYLILMCYNLFTHAEFDDKVQQSKDDAEEALKKIPEIEARIEEAEDKTREAQDNLAGAEQDAKMARDIATDAEDIAKMASDVNKWLCTGFIQINKKICNKY